MGAPAALAAHLRAAHGWGDVAVSPGPRGAQGRIWRVDVGPARYALKEGAGPPPPAAAVERELLLARRAAEAGVRSPAAVPDREGRWVSPGPGRTWLRLHAWVDLRPLDAASPAVPPALGELLARLHRCAPAATTEADGSPPSGWYERVPPARERAAAVAAAATAGVPWAGPLAERLAHVPELLAGLAPAAADGLVLCHRDLQPKNVLAGPDGGLVVVDWEDAGPAVPARELLRALFDWFVDGPAADLDAVREVVSAYVRAGGPGRVTGPADASLLVASRLNFLLSQVRTALDPGTPCGDREHAEQEVDEGLRLLPTARQLADVLAAARAAQRTARS